MLKGCNVQMSPPHEMGFLILERSFYSKWIIIIDQSILLSFCFYIYLFIVKFNIHR
jgi:hypothetical protein